MKLVQWNMLCLEQLFISSRKCAIMKLYSYGNLILQCIYYRNFFSISSVVQYRTCLFLFLFLYFIIYASLKWSLCSILCSYCVQGNIFLINSLLLSSSSERFNRMISKFMCFCLNYFNNLFEHNCVKPRTGRRARWPQGKHIPVYSTCILILSTNLQR